MKGKPPYCDCSSIDSLYQSFGNNNIYPGSGTTGYYYGSFGTLYKKLRQQMISACQSEC